MFFKESASAYPFYVGKKRRVAFEVELTISYGAFLLRNYVMLLG
jgi:hypothetical protein